LVAPGSIAARAIGWRLVAPRSIATRRSRLAFPRFVFAWRPTFDVRLWTFDCVGPRAHRPVPLLEPIARILVRAARPPIGVAPLAARRRLAVRRLCRTLAALEVFVLRFARFPEPAAREPLQGDVRIFSLQLMEGGQELFPLPGPECRWRAVDEDRPVR